MAIDLQHLANRYPNVHLFQQGSLQGIAINNAFCEARFLLQGAQLIHFKPHLTSQHNSQEQEPWFWLGREADFSGREATRGGVPICLPWFGQLDRNPEPVRDMTRGIKPPNHGFCRNSIWQLAAFEEHSCETVLCFELHHSETSKVWWPYHFIARVEFVLGESLTINLSYQNLSETEVAISCALHSYFLVSDLGLTLIQGLENCRYVDALDYWRGKRQQGAIVINQLVDRIYTETPSRIVIEDQGWGRNLILNTFNSRSSVVWNPWQKAAEMSQISDGEFLRFVCVETANVLNDFACLAQNEVHQLSLSITEEKNLNALF